MVNALASIQVPTYQLLAGVFALSTAHCAIPLVRDLFKYLYAHRAFYWGGVAVCCVAYIIIACFGYTIENCPTAPLAAASFFFSIPAAVYFSDFSAFLHSNKSVDCDCVQTCLRSKHCLGQWYWTPALLLLCVNLWWSYSVGTSEGSIYNPAANNTACP